MDFSVSPRLSALRSQVREFIDTRVIPQEDRIRDEDWGSQHSTLHRLQDQVREAGLWAPHLPVEWGGQGLGISGMCTLFRDMGRSPVGARVFHCDAPDQGNMDLLLRAASPALKDKFLRPLCEGRITSAFCMTEPAPGAGADPSNLRTRAVADGGDWVLDGHKWYSTGGGDAAFLIVMARTSEDREKGATLLVVDRHAPGVEHVRDIDTFSEPLLQHREAEFRFHQVRVSADAVLGGVGEGFALAQARLVPARLTHCMRWLGLADRTLSMCREYITTRISFGSTLSQHQLIQEKIARHATAIHAGNLMTLHCAWLLETGDPASARGFSSMVKNHVASLLCDVLDDAMQMHGGLGYSRDMPFGDWYRHARAAPIADGPTEVHIGVVAREYLRGRLPLLE